MGSGLRILELLPFFSPSLGGPPVQVRAVCRELAARGHRVSVITSDLGAGEERRCDEWIEEDGFRLWCASTRPWQKVPPYPIPRVRSVLRQAAADADLLCMNIALTFWNVAGRAAAARAGIPYVYKAEGALCPTRLRIKGLRKRAWLAAFERRILRDASGLHACTEAEAADYLRQGAARDRIRVIPNGVSLEPPAPRELGLELRRELGIAEDAVVVLFLGRLHAIKGLDLLVESAAPVAKDEPGLCIVLAGPDEGERARIEAQARAAGLSDRIRWPGLLVGQRKRAAFAAADLFALTSRTEGLPVAVLEAAAAGLPLWISDRCNVPEVLRYDAGTVDPLEPARLTASLRELVRDVDGRVARGQNARRMAQECFALERVVDRLEGFYRDVVASR